MIHIVRMLAFGFNASIIPWLINVESSLGVRTPRFRPFYIYTCCLILYTRVETLFPRARAFPLSLDGGVFYLRAIAGSSLRRESTP